ncbi:hypothetical protein Hanom_Chr06g00523871 [Helianthus anomalus]
MCTRFQVKLRLLSSSGTSQKRRMTSRSHGTAEEEVLEPGFVTLLRGVVKKAQDHCVLKEELVRFWGTIATAPFSNNMVASDIRDPVHRFIHKILASTLIGRPEGDNKVNHHSLL